jgi:signal transduction histidine kinase
MGGIVAVVSGSLGRAPAPRWIGAGPAHSVARGGAPTEPMRSARARGRDVVDWFLVRCERGGDPAPVEDRERGRLVVALLGVLSLAATFFAAYLATDRIYGLAAICLASLGVWTGALVYLRRTGNVERVAAGLCAAMFLAVVASSWMALGPATTLGPWGLVVPLLATYLRGIRSGVAYGAWIVAVAVVQAAAQVLQWWSPNHLAQSAATEPVRVLVAGTVTLAVVLLIAGLSKRTEVRARAKLLASLQDLERSKHLLSHTEKMATVGKLMGNLAHEINNPLGVIVGFSQGLQSRVPEGDPLRLPVDSIVREAARCRTLIQEILAFSHKGRMTQSWIGLDAMIRGTLPLLEPRAKAKRVSLWLDLAGALPPLHGSPTRIQEVIVNLAANALDASPEGGSVTLRTRVDDAGWVRLEVVDEGEGIPPELRDRVLEPFFTTKEPGKGTGLGLWIVHEIVHQHGGTLELEDRTRGTTIAVRFPVREDQPR